MNFLKRAADGIRWRVSSGPFRGTACRFTEGGDGVVAKLAATYEKEIYPAFEHAIGRQPVLAVDVGAAEGFYVVGLAKALPAAKVVAYEAKQEWQRRIRTLAEKNGVGDRCEIRGFCDKAEFRRMLEEAQGKRVFVLMDIEGGEFELLGADVIPLLGGAELLVELHERDSRAAGDALIRMFEGTHQVQVIWSEEPRSLKDVPALGWRLAATFLPPVRSRLEEGRGYRMRWMHAVPKAAAGMAGV